MKVEILGPKVWNLYQKESENVPLVKASIFVGHIEMTTHIYAWV